MTLAVTLAVIAVVAYGAHRLWLKTDDLLRPAVVPRDADARAVVEPSLGARWNALLGHARAPAGTRPRLVALTFDDGPYPVTTPLLLQTLHDLGVPATFFLIGRDAEQFPDLAREVAASGGEIADHTLTHPDLDRLSPLGVQRELREGAATLEGIAPDADELHEFRPPHGRYTADTIRAAQGAGFDTILWNDDPGDWRAVPAAAIVEHVRAHATAPEIVLLHSGRTATVEALPRIVAAYRAAGFRFVTVAAMLREAGAEALNRPERAPLP